MLMIVEWGDGRILPLPLRQVALVVEARGVISVLDSTVGGGRGEIGIFVGPFPVPVFEARDCTTVGTVS